MKHYLSRRRFPCIMMSGSCSIRCCIFPLLNFNFFGEAKIKIFILKQIYYNRPLYLRFHFARDSKMYQFVVIEKIIEDGTTSVKHLLTEFTKGHVSILTAFR